MSEARRKAPMASVEKGTRDEIAQCLSRLRGYIEALENSEDIDERVLRELTQIVDEIEGHIEVASEPRIRIVPD
jgi:hypothetical protein